MTYRPLAPPGAPCGVDLWTSDIEGSRQFYAELFGWEAGVSSPDHGGYFMFTRAGIPVAGAMGDMARLAPTTPGSRSSLRRTSSTPSTSPLRMVPRCRSRSWRSTISAVRR
jgi:catechol 2,3-dioxygenase-like lactoylglutathione lyase family enzyme